MSATTTGRVSLPAAIAAQERRVREFDRQLGESMARIERRLDARRRGGRSGLLWTVGPFLGSWLLMRLRRRRPGPMRVASRPDRIATLVEGVLPTLAPVIGVHAAALLSVLATLPRERAASVPMVAQRVDLNLFAGTWHEIARLPERHERKCAAAVTATYVRDGAGLRVINRCQRANGRLVVATGRARVADRESRAKLKISLAPRWLRWLPLVWADTWILDVSPDYRRALLGTPDRRYLWILAREPVLPSPEYRALVLIAAAQGYDTQQLRLTTPTSVW